MTQEQLARFLEKEIANFSGQTALVVSHIYDPQPLFAHQPGAVFPAASLIKTAILLAALEEVRQGRLTLKDRLEVPQRALLPDTMVFEEGPGFYRLEELLYWMIVDSDNTAANVILELIGLEAVNAYCAGQLGLEHTLCRRKMLDLDAARAGRDNLTTAADQQRMYCLLQGGGILNPSLRGLALSILLRQRSMDAMLRYIAADVPLAHKTGSLDGVAHDCGLFLFRKRPLFVGICTWDGPSPDGGPVQKRYIARLAKAIFHVYQEV